MVEIFHFFISTAGKPAMIELSFIFLVTPLFAAIWTLLPIVRCPEMPVWPPITTLSPIEVLPAIPLWPAIIAPSPIMTLWAIWTKLSINEFLEIIVESKTALSIVVFDPILQLSPIKTLPVSVSYTHLTLPTILLV